VAGFPIACAPENQCFALRQNPWHRSDGGRTKSNQSRLNVQGSAAPDVSPLNAQSLNHFINHPQIMFICAKIGKAAVKEGVKLFRSG
tara:strand:- start:148 stop:408 length:261 start_codon:yes stop_codon:yes gene_type:complete